MAAKSVRSHAPVLLAALALQAALGWVLAQAYLAGHNTLFANGRWEPGKVGLERGLIGAWSFLTERQSLAGGELHLEAWHGYQEVTLRQPQAALRSLAFDFRLGKGGYLVVFFHRAGERPYDAVRLGSHWRFPSAWLRVDPAGAFVETRSLDPGAVESGRSHRARLEFQGRQVELFVDERSLGRAAVTPVAPHAVGFRGGKHAAVVDNVDIEDGRGRLLERFSAPARAAQIRALAVGGAVALNLLILWPLVRRLGDRPKRFLFSYLMIGFTLLVIGLLVLAFVSAGAAWYPGLDAVLAEREAWFRSGQTEEILAGVRERLGEDPAGTATRILFVGSSQTWGAGARRAGETFVSRLESKLNAGRPETRHLCLNMGISSARARELAEIVTTELEHVTPRLVVFNLASNDRSSRDFRAAMTRMIEATLAAGAEPVLVKEANSPLEVDRGLRARHHELDELGARRGIRVIDLHGQLEKLNGTGFLWWDKVHLSSYGHRLAADILYEELRSALAAGAEGS